MALNLRRRQAALIGLIVVATSLSTGLTRSETSAATAATTRPNVTLDGPGTDTFIGKPNCPLTPSNGHGWITKVLRHGKIYLRLTVPSREQILDGHAGYWSTHDSGAITRYTRPWVGNGLLPTRTTVRFEGKTEPLKLGGAEVHAYDPDVQTHGCKPATSRLPRGTGYDAPPGYGPNLPARVLNVVPAPSRSAINLRWANPGGSADDGTYIIRSGGPAHPARPFSPDGQINLATGATQYVDSTVVPGYTYVYTLYAHRKDGSIGPPERVSVAALPPGHYTVKVVVAKDLVKEAGGWARVKTKVAKQFAQVNRTFNAPNNHLLLRYDFRPNRVLSYNGTCKSAMEQPHPRSTFLLVEARRCSREVIRKSIVEEWSDRYEAVINPYHDDGQDAFGQEADDTLVHEFGHSRGAIDEYNVKVSRSRNTITETHYWPPAPSIMNYPYGVHQFDTYTQDVINSEGSSLELRRTQTTAASLLPRHIQIQVLANGTTLTSPVTVRLWAVGWGVKSVSTYPAWTGVTNDQGLVDVPAHIWSRPSSQTWWNINTPLFLVTAVHSGVGSGWLSIIEATVATYDDPASTYVVTLNIKSPTTPPPTPTPTATGTATPAPTPA